MIRIELTRRVAASTLMLVGTGAFAPAVVHAQTTAQSPGQAFAVAPTPEAPPTSNPLFRYVQFYGNVDVGYSFQTHGNAFNNDLPTNVNVFLTKYNNASNRSIVSNGLSFSTIGAKSAIPLSSDVSGIFQLETSFNPASGTLANGPGSLAANNGLAPANYSSFGDSNKAGQILNGNAFIGFDSKQYGRLTVGRNSALMNDMVCRYDALFCAPAFSYVGYFGGPAGIGDTEDRFMDATVKYVGNFGALRLGALYQGARYPSVSGGKAQGSAFQVNIGSTVGAFSVDGVVASKKDGIFLVSPLTGAQVAAIGTVGSATYGLPTDKTLNGIVSDNKAYAIFTRYDAGKLRFFGGYEYVRQVNPASPLASGTETIGGYRVLTINAAYPKPKVTQYAWLGARYTFNRNWEMAGSYYHAHQSSYGATSCSDTRSGQCSGRYVTHSSVLDYKFDEESFLKGFDIYGGFARTSANGGIANGFLNGSNLSTMVGIRFIF